MPREWTPAMQHALAALDALFDEERTSVMAQYCRGCGRQEPWHPGAPPEIKARKLGCQCENDD